MPEFDDPRLTLPAGGTRLTLQVSASATALRKAPEANAERGSQLLHGERVVLHHEEAGFALVQNQADRYVGWVETSDLAPAAKTAPTHRVRALRAFAYTHASIKSAITHTLSLGASLSLGNESDGRFVHADATGWMYADQLRAIDSPEDDPAAVASRYLNTPYMWGGRDSIGIDCSGLVQQAFAACAIALPRDSDMQYAWAGEALTDWQQPGLLRRNDLVFWKGHVGIMLDTDLFLHANGHHMCVASEPLESAISRIATQYGEPIGARRIDLARARQARPAWLDA